MTIKLGSKLPRKAVQTNQHEKLNLNELKGQIVVLYFYPRDNTPGCTTESCDFQSKLKQFEKLGAIVVGASRDTLKSHDKFADKFDLQFPLIADPEETLCEHYGVMKDKNMYGKKVRGIERSTFLYNKDGELVQEWRKVKVPGHVDEVLEAVKTIS